MSKLPPPKAVLFDIGGVCVLSPFQAILDYERAHGIPVGYINATIASTAPDGSWQRLERGEIALGEAFFAQFGAELSDAARWEAYHRQRQRQRRGRRQQQQQQSEERKEKDKSDGAAADSEDANPPPPMPRIDAKELFWNMMRMSRQPDPHMWPALRRLRDSGRFVVAALSNTIAFPDGIRDERGVVFESGLTSGGGGAAPAAGAATKGAAATDARRNDSEHRPTTTRTTRFLQGSRALDLELEQRSGEDGGRHDVRAAFDLFVSSAHVGMRKPERRIYELALRELRRLAAERGVRIEGPRDVVFLDDIGANLRMARELGMRTVKVNLGRVQEAVRELEGVVGMDLGSGERARM